MLFFYLVVVSFYNITTISMLRSFLIIISVTLKKKYFFLLVQKSTIQLLRFKFSYFLMPVYWFALSFVNSINWYHAICIFAILHLLVYPSSNGYNSYMDKDEGSIGGIVKPMQPTIQLFYATIVLDIIAVIASFLLGFKIGIGILVYIIFSRLYSFKGIRLKRYAVLGYLTVIANQGALVFWLVYTAANNNANNNLLAWQCIVSAAFLIGGFYPITQVYQHQADAKDGVKTISMLLGKKGTFIFCAIMYLIAFSLLFQYYYSNHLVNNFYMLQIFFIPVIVYFFRWFLQVYKNDANANFEKTMQMNWLASTCTSLAFITLIILKTR
jgi:1,4-dihydroxy-2-naphthoate polyprenyltransferase